MIRVYDCRLEKDKVSKKTLDTSGLDLNGFLKVIQKEFPIPSRETFVLVTTDRTVVDYDKFGELQDGSTLYLLRREDQDLPASVVEDISFVPHYNTLIESGSYEYFAEGQKSLPCSLAELVDNSLTATAKNTGARTVEIRMLFDKTVGKPAVVVLDNGSGMTSKQLNNWAVYRLSKFERKNSTFRSEEQEYVPPDRVTRSLNSDISYFGIGGKRAVFHIGTSVRMISKPVSSPDVHELVLSKEEFKKKEQNKEDVYKGTILNRKPGDSSHITDDERFLRAVISEEVGKQSFTAVVITGVCPDHVDYLKTHFGEWTRELAHIYHYYIHGVDGNDVKSSRQKSEDFQKIDILVTLREKPPKCPRAMNLREVKDDMQTLYINTAVDSFEFGATTKDGGTVEGILRYHPFLYDKETYPKDPYAPPVPVDEDEFENESESPNQARGKRDVFECFWNGRLIPYTTISDFDWCARPSKGATLPAECYGRFSGVLFTDDKFEVNVNKLKFMNLEMKLKNKETIFTPVGSAQTTSKRGNIQKEFSLWIQSCHEKFDKQVEFLGFISTITRTDVQTKRLQCPWGTFSSIVVDREKFKRGQLVKSTRTQPVYHGKVERFLLYGDYDGNVFATGGQVEIKREPEALYDKTTKIIPISKIDRTATVESIKKVIESDIDKLPEKLKVDWPEGNAWPQNAIRPAGTPFGPITVVIVNRKGQALSSRIPTGGHGIRLSVGLRVVQHDSNGDKEVVDLVAPYVTTLGHWFKKIETQLTNVGKYTLTLSTMINDSWATSYGGKELPSFVLRFTIKEGNAESFTVGAISSTLRVGVAFNIPLLIKDAHNHSATPPVRLEPVLVCSDLKLTYESVSNSGTTITIKGVRARGKVQDYQQSKSYDLNVILPGLKNDTQIITISLLPGNPHSLHVKPDANPIEMQNGDPACFNVEVHDEAGNITANPRQLVHCRVAGLPLVITDCSSTGTGQVVTKPVNLNIINGEPQMLKAEFNMPTQKHMAPFVTELKVLPSTRVSRMELFCRSQGKLALKNEEKIEWPAGGVLENLYYNLFDESHRKVPVTAEIASSIKVNWTADVDLESLIKGRLPDIQVPTQVSEERFYQVSYQNLSVSFCFSITPCPDEPARLKVTLPENTVKLGEILYGQIKLDLVDQYDNATKGIDPSCLNNMSVEAEGLDASSINFKWQENSGSVLVTGLRFQSGSLGPKEVTFSNGSFSERVIVTLTAGIASQFKLISEPKQPLQVLNGHGIPTPFVVQLCDAWGNPSPDKRVVVKIVWSPQGLKVLSAVTSQPVDAEGKASFTVTSVQGSKGYYQLGFQGSFNSKPIPGPSVNLTVIPDPNKPVRLQVDYDTTAMFLAGGTFPVFSVTVVSDEGSPIMTVNPASLSMLLWEGVLLKPPPTATNLKCSKPLKNDKKDCFYFRNKPVPERVGRHTLQFFLRIDKTEVLQTNPIDVNVVANQPFKLAPDAQPPTPVVSYSTDISSRILIEDMTLKIMDKFGNSAGQDLNGKVIISIRCPDGERSTSLPLFEGNTSSVQISLIEGSAHISRLVIRKNSPGENGSRYVLLCEPDVPILPTSLTPFELPFHFYNDTDNQRKMAELTKEKDKLKEAIARYNVRSKTSSDLQISLKNTLLEANKKELSLRKELVRININPAQALPIPAIEKILKEKIAEAERVLKVPRRVCRIANNFSGPDVLGMVGHLALIADDDAARVISWHLGGDLDCVVTRTTAAAMNINHTMQGRQQLMPLDGIFRQHNNGVLPHMKLGRRFFNPPGNPIFAKDVLIYPHDEQSCRIVFENLLGTTMLMDDLESATNYRKTVVENKIQCPTILTRQGDRVSSKGKFGGNQNRAPPISYGSVRVFGAPLPPQYHELKEHLDLLNNYLLQVKKKEIAENEHNTHMMSLNTPERLEMHQRHEQRKKQIEEIDRQLASASLNTKKRGPENGGETSGIQPKRLRQRSRETPQMF